MDEDAFRQTYDDLRDYPCVFEKAILNRQCGCSLVRRLSLGEREGATCSRWGAHKDCKKTLDVIRHNARFVVKATRIPGPLPHARELKVQVGGMTGLQAEILGREVARVEDIHAVIRQALARYGSLDELPFQTMIQAITAFKGRRRHTPRD